MAPAPIPLVAGILAAFVAYGRWRLTSPGAGSADPAQRTSGAV